MPANPVCYCYFYAPIIIVRMKNKMSKDIHPLSILYITFYHNCKLYRYPAFSSTIFAKSEHQLYAFRSDTPISIAAPIMLFFFLK